MAKKRATLSRKGRKELQNQGGYCFLIQDVQAFLCGLAALREKRF
jgi:hypothetical protein